MVENSAAVVERLQNPDDRFVFKIRGVRYWYKKPISYVVYHLPYAYGTRIEPGRLTRKPFLPQFEKMLGCSIAEGIQSIYPNCASAHVAEKLGIQEGAPILSVDTVYISENHLPVYFIQNSYEPEYRHEIRIRRTRTERS
jgi:GntR family transcriptional regulator